MEEERKAEEETDVLRENRSDRRGSVFGEEVTIECRETNVIVHRSHIKVGRR